MSFVVGRMPPSAARQKNRHRRAHRLRLQHTWFLRQASRHDGTGMRSAAAKLLIKIDLSACLALIYNSLWACTCCMHIKHTEQTNYVSTAKKCPRIFGGLEYSTYFCGVNITQVKALNTGCTYHSATTTYYAIHLKDKIYDEKSTDECCRWRHRRQCLRGPLKTD